MRILRDMLVLGIAAFFAVMWGLMLRDKVMVSPSQPVRPSYERLLAPGEESRTVVLGIYRGSVRLGHTRTTITRGENVIQLRSNTRFELGDLVGYLAPNVQELEVMFNAAISPLAGLQHMRVSCPQLNLTLRGFVREDRLYVRGRVGGEKVSRQIPYARQPFLGDVLSPMSGLPELQRARPGDVWTMHVVNPLLGGVQKVRVRLAGTRKFAGGGESLQVHELVFSAGGRSWRSCVTGEGRVLMQGTPFGLTLRRENISPALKEFVQTECLPGREPGQR